MLKKVQKFLLAAAVAGVASLFSAGTASADALLPTRGPSITGSDRIEFTGRESVFHTSDGGLTYHSQLPGYVPVLGDILLGAVRVTGITRPAGNVTDLVTAGAPRFIEAIFAQKVTGAPGGIIGTPPTAVSVVLGAPTVADYAATFIDDAGGAVGQPVYSLGTYLDSATREILAVYRPLADITDLDPLSQKALLDAAKGDGSLYFGMGLSPSATGPSAGYGYSQGQVPPTDSNLQSFGAANVTRNPLGLRFSPVNDPAENLFNAGPQLNDLYFEVTVTFNTASQFSSPPAPGRFAFIAQGVANVSLVPVPASVWGGAGLFGVIAVTRVRRVLRNRGPGHVRPGGLR